jgi:hypothetical protein
VRTPSSLQTINLFNEAALKEHAKGIVGIDAANLFDAGLGHRLPIRDYGQGLKWRSSHIGTTSSNPCQHGASLFGPTRKLELITVDEQRDSASRQRRLKLGNQAIERRAVHLKELRRLSPRQWPINHEEERF